MTSRPTPCACSTEEFLGKYSPVQESCRKVSFTVKVQKLGFLVCACGLRDHRLLAEAGHDFMSLCSRFPDRTCCSSLFPLSEQIGSSIIFVWRSSPPATLCWHPSAQVLMHWQVRAQVSPSEIDHLPSRLSSIVDRDTRACACCLRTHTLCFSGS